MANSYFSDLSDLRQSSIDTNRELMRRGMYVQAAVACGITSKGPWRSSKTPGIQQALSNAYLKYQGLFALRDGWIKLHHST
nr:hypothetical protein [Agarivorans sp. Alg241-V36]